MEAGTFECYGDQLLRSVMRNSSFPAITIVLMVAFCSCKSNYICPSYESAYILDQQTRHSKFSLFDEDTLPKKDMDASKNRYLVIEDIQYRKKRDQMRTVKMETIFPQVEPPDTLLLAEQDLSLDDMEQLLDEGERPVNRFNVDQIYYMRHFGQYLPMPEDPSNREQDGQEGVEEEMLEEPVVQKRKKWQFWKKKMDEVDSLNIGIEEEFAEPEEEEMSRKELRRQEELEEQEQEELEKARQPNVIDLEDFEKDREAATPAVEETPSRKRKEQNNPSENKKKIKLGFGKKNKVDEVEIEE